MVYADDLVVGARGKVATVWGEADGVNRAKVVAHVAELARFGVGEVVGLVYRLGGPDSDMAICAGSGFCLGKEGRERNWARAYHRRPLQASSRPGRHGSCKPRSPSVRLSHPAKTSVSGGMHACLCLDVLTAMAQPGRLDKLHYWGVARTLGGDGFALSDAAGRDVM